MFGKVVSLGLRLFVALAAIALIQHQLANQMPTPQTGPKFVSADPDKDAQSPSGRLDFLQILAASAEVAREMLGTPTEPEPKSSLEQLEARSRTVPKTY